MKSPKSVVASKKALQRKRQKTNDSTATSSSIESLPPNLVIAPNFVYDVFDKADPLEPIELELLKRLKNDCFDPAEAWRRPIDDLAARLSKLNSRGQNAFMNAVFHGKHGEAITLLLVLPNLAQRRSIVTQVSHSKANVLHAAAARGNLEFLKAFQAEWSSWGLNDVDVRDLLSAKESHEATPRGMAEFQDEMRGRDRKAVLHVLRQLETMVQLDVMRMFVFPE
jgi:hypothetical protein